MNRSRNWLITVNSIPENVKELLSALCADKGLNIRYLIFGLEKAPTTSHAHLQGFAMFDSLKSFKQVKACFKDLNSPNIVLGDGKAHSMMRYCKKDGRIFFEFGTAPMSQKAAGKLGGVSKGVNYRRIVDLACQGRLNRIREKYPKQYLAYYRTLQSIYKDNGVAPKDLEEVCGVWIYGPAGAGKSHYARAEYGPVVYDKPCNKWWDHYQGEDTALLDDFDRRHDGLAHHLKRWADRYSFSGEIKGSQISLRPKRVVVTSQYRISEIWEDEAIKAALNRRFIKIKVHIDSQGNRVIQNQGF